MTTNRLLSVFLSTVTVLAVLLAACAPSSAATATEPLVAEPTATLRPPTPVPTVAEATATPLVSDNWTSHASTATELSFEHPGEWFGPAELPNKDGVYIKDPDRDIGVLLRFWKSGTPASRLAAWGSEGIDIPFVLKVTFESVSDSEPVTISRLEADTRLAQGGGLTARAAFVQRPDDVLEVMWYAPAEQWEALQEAFTRFLASLEIWRKHSQSGLQTIYLHDWSKPAAPPDGQGNWYQSADQKSGLVIWLRTAEDPLQKLAEWQPDGLAGLGLTGCTPGATGERLSTMQAEFDAKSGECEASGTQANYVVAFVPNRDRLLEIVTYAPAEAWEYSERIFDTMLGLMTDLR